MGVSGVQAPVTRLMRCFFYQDLPVNPGGVIELPPDLQHHLLRVLRLEPGEQIRLFDGNGRFADALLQPCGMAEIRHVAVAAPPTCRITLIQGLPKGEKTELILQKGTELGVSDFVLVPMARSIMRLKSRPRQQQRWKKIIQEAARQCRQYHLPRLHVATSFADALATGGAADLKLLLWEETAHPLDLSQVDGPPRQIAVVVGPEGGISRGEAEQALKQGYQPAGLGERILRTETASLAIISILQYLYGDLAQTREPSTK